MKGCAVCPADFQQSKATLNVNLTPFTPIAGHTKPQKNCKVAFWG